jgi:hypothetical protein
MHTDHVGASTGFAPSMNDPASSSEGVQHELPVRAQALHSNRVGGRIVARADITITLRRLAVPRILASGMNHCVTIDALLFGAKVAVSWPEPDLKAALIREALDPPHAGASFLRVPAAYGEGMAHHWQNQ